MDFTLTDEQSMLRDTVGAYLADNYDFASRHAAIRSDAGWRPETWRALAEDLGVLGAAIPERFGGFGGGSVETMVLMEAFGRALLLEPFVPTVVIGGGLLQYADHPAADQLLGEVIAGRTTFALAAYERSGRFDLAAVETRAMPQGSGWVLDGRKIAVAHAPHATHLIVTARTAGAPREPHGLSLFLVDRQAPGVAIDAYTGADGIRAADVRFDRVALGADALLGPADAGFPLIERVVDEAVVATCAEACGIMRVMLDSTVDFTRQRKQFGAALSSFQTLQHRMADMFIEQEQSRSMTYMATIRVGEQGSRARAASAAKVQIGKACRFVGENAVQLHGGMGVTDETAISHYFRRSAVIESSFGSVDYHFARFERLG